jgi:hypothetical protein
MVDVVEKHFASLVRLDFRIDRSEHVRDFTYPIASIGEMEGLDGPVLGSGRPVRITDGLKEPQ